MIVGRDDVHMIDRAPGGGGDRGGYDSQVPEAFTAARSFVAPFASSSADECFGECVRALRRRVQRRLAPGGGRATGTLAPVRSRHMR